MIGIDRLVAAKRYTLVAPHLHVVRPLSLLVAGSAGFTALRSAIGDGTMQYGTDDDRQRCLGPFDGVEDAVASDPRNPDSTHPAPQRLAVLTRIEEQAIHGVYDGMLRVQRKLVQQFASASREPELSQARGRA